MSSWNPRKEVNEMDVTLTPNLIYTAPQTDPEAASIRKAVEAAGINTQASNSEIVKEIHEKVLMDLKDVQQFLYMLIGSHIKVEPESEIVGRKVNTVA
jgi:hypothetical protein